MSNDFEERIALFPFENLTDDSEALNRVMPVIRDRLGKRGIQLVGADKVNDLLLDNRVRVTGYVSRDLAQRAGEEFNAKAIMVGSVVLFSSGENPQFGLSARLVGASSGRILWANYVSATGEDFTTVLGLGTIQAMDELIGEVVDRLLTTVRTVPPRIEKELTYKIAVMPFRNNSKARGAGMVSTYMFLVELFKSSYFEMVEYGEVRETIVDSRIRYRGELDHRGIETLADSLGLDAILVGSVDLYSDGLETSSPPKVEISARLIDAHSKKIIWFDSVQYQGDSKLIAFDWGRIRSVDGTAYQAISELVKKMETAKWR